MPKYVISYDLLKPGQIYDQLMPALRKQGAKQLLLSTWGLNTPLSAVEIRDWLTQYVDVNDRLVVIELKGWAVYRAMADPKDI